MYNLIVEYWPLILSLVGIVIWGIRLEGVQKMHATLIHDSQDQLKDLRIKHEALDSKVLEKISQIQQTVARIEGMLESRNGNLS